MTYEEALTYLYNSMPAFHLVGATAYKPGLDNAIRLMAHLDNPQNTYPTIHIAGTNGKGSTSHLIAAALQAAGKKVGLYTSPHLVDFRERIRVLQRSNLSAQRSFSDSGLSAEGGLSAQRSFSDSGLSAEGGRTTIPPESVVAFVEKHKAFLDELKPSFFETTMALAFDYFRQQQVDVAVIEVGLGGRLDATNIITPQLSVITNIGLDHEEFLGDTLAKIAFEKAGIIKPHVPCVIGESHPETDPVFLAKAQECGILGEGLETTHCRIWFADQCGYLRRCRERDIRECELKGIYQEHNQQTAYVALRQLGVSTHAIREGFAHVCTRTGLRGRWEHLYARNRHFILDTGHNSHGFRYVCEQLTSLPISLSANQPISSPFRGRPGGGLHLILGFVNDKDVDVMLGMLPLNATYYFTQAQTSRAIPAADLAKFFSDAVLQRSGRTAKRSFSDSGLSVPAVYQTQPVASAIEQAIKNTTPDDIIFIGGSNYVVGEALSFLNSNL